MSWDLKFPEPIAVAGRQRLITLRDAATYVTTLPTSEQAETRWQNAVHVLIQAADNGGPIEFARIGMMQALHPRGASLRRQPQGSALGQAEAG